MLSYKRINDITGWVVFLIAAATFTLTVEPTASFWDCGEFIAVSYKLMTPHPPGAPLFLLVGRIFSLFAGGEALSAGASEDAAFWVNMVSAMSSAFTILFLFWSITLIARKVLKVVYDEPTMGQTLAIMGSGIVGALAYTFSDSFWFSASEAEVYAFSAFFTAFVFWAILKWEVKADNEGSDRWLILIAYMVGLSIGVHLLNLVTIPAMAFVFYYRKFKPSITGALATLALSSAILVIILVIIIPGIPSIAGWFEIKFVNGLGLPFNSGIIFFAVLFIGAITYGVMYSIKHKKRWMNTALLSLIFILIGYSTYFLIIIRSNFNPPIDENNPEEVTKFVSYLKREQYGDRPLFYGPQWTSQVGRSPESGQYYEYGDPIYQRGEDGYEIYDYKTNYYYPSNQQTLFPRMHSKQPHHTPQYESWMREHGYRFKEGKLPTGAQNIHFMINRQIGFFYWRYFLWNFVGREGDIQDSGVLWFSNEKLPELIQSAARNQFFALPLILGLLGVAFLGVRDNKMLLILGMLWFFTGAAIILYLNPPPIEPRERDYAYAGSFYAFSFFIGLGVLALYELIKDYIKNTKLAAGLATVIGLVIPIIMGAQGWDDHDRSSRYHSVDSAKNLLASCAPNAILFTGGDNDTFPLWYVQEVEGFRTDVRVCNLSLLNTDWYIDQMKRQAYDSEPLPIRFENKDYIQGTNDYIQYYNQSKEDKAMNLDAYLNAVENRSRQIGQYSQVEDIQKFQTVLPSKQVYIATDAEQIKNLDFIPEKLKPLAKNTLEWKLNRGGGIDKKDLIMLDMITNINKDGWKRPIYFSTTLSSSNYIGLRDHMVLEGLAYRLLPIKHGRSQGIVNSDVMYDNMMNNFYWREMNNPNIFYDENYKRFVFNARMQYMQLAFDLISNDNDKEKAKAVIHKSLEVMPDNVFPHDYIGAQFVSLLFEVGDKETAKTLAMQIAPRTKEMLDYYVSSRNTSSADFQRYASTLGTLQSELEANGEKEEAAKIKAWMDDLSN